MTDESWYPLYEAMVELDVPAMIHVSSSCNPNFHTLGAHYLNADTAVFMQLLEGDLFGRVPDVAVRDPARRGSRALPLGSVPRARRADGTTAVEEHLMGNVFFDTCVYHQAGIDLLFRVVGADNLLFASEMLGAVRGTNPETGSGWDDTKRYLDRVDLDEVERAPALRGQRAPGVPAARWSD
jgi:4-oxalmesaconate hydratase